MEIDITSFFTNAAPMDYAASQMELGPSAAADTWRAAMSDLSEWRLLSTYEQLDAMRDFVRESGGWTREEITAMSDDELRALLVQFIAGDMREAGIDRGNSDRDEFDWSTYQTQCENGNLAGRFYRADDGKIYYYLGS